jgi:hypothetical protein
VIGFAEFNIKITQEEIDSFCAMGKDLNPQHRSDADRVVVPGLLTVAKSLGETDVTYFTVWLIEQQFRFKKSIYLDEPVTVRHSLMRERTTPKGTVQHINIDVKVNEDVRFTGSMKILKVPK